jgi:hypothetical protein
MKPQDNSFDKQRPLPRTDLSYSLSPGYAKRREAIEDRSADLDLSNLPLEVSCGVALT